MVATAAATVHCPVVRVDFCRRDPLQAPAFQCTNHCTASIIGSAARQGMSSAHRDRHDAVPTVTEFASLAETSRGTAARQPSWKGATDGHHCAVNAKSDPVTAAAGRADYQSEAGFSLGETRIQALLAQRRRRWGRLWRRGSATAVAVEGSRGWPGPSRGAARAGRDRAGRQGRRGRPVKRRRPPSGRRCR
jgi:hypothetical protein